jgi:predicted ATPase
MSETFIGRGRELGQLTQALDAARAGRGTTALVIGDAGIGKSRLASQVVSQARDAGCDVFIRRCR